MTRILVTGGAGFVGSHLVDKLIHEGFKVVVLDNFSSGKHENIKKHLNNNKFSLVKGDILNKKKVKYALKDVTFVFHLAASVSVNLSVKQPYHVNAVNVVGTLNVLKESVKEKVERVVYASSCAVYGEPKYLPIDEEHTTQPVSPYGVSKLAAEQYCKVFNQIYNLETVCLRFFNIYGIRQTLGPYTGVITKFINKLTNNECLIIDGTGEQTRDFIFIKDIIKSCLQALHSKKSAGEIVNVGTGVETSINILANTLIALFNKSKKEITYTEPVKGEIQRSYANVKKVQNNLGFLPKISLKEGLIELIQELKLTR